MPFLVFCEEKFKMKKKPNLKYLYMQRITCITIDSFKILFEIETTNIHSKFYSNELEMF